MSQLQKLEANSQQFSSEKPAVGVVSTGNNHNEVTRIVLRAIVRDHPVIVLHEGDKFPFPELQLLSGVYFVSLETEAIENSQNVQNQLITAARTLSSLGLIHVVDTSRLVDFDRSTEQFDNEEFIQQAISTGKEHELQTLVAIPAYNESETIKKVIKTASPFTDEIVVINDGSADNTKIRAQEAGAAVVTHEYNQGYGAALQTAFEVADERDVNCLVIIDGDGQHDPCDIQKLSQRVTDKETNVVIGSRFVDGADSDIPVYRRFGLSVVNTLTNISMGNIRPKNWIRDTQSGFRAYDQEAIEVLSSADIGNGMDASLDIIYQLNAEEMHFEETPTEISYDVEDGHSKNPFSHGLSLVGTILRTVEREHPILLLGVPGFILTMVGLIFCYMTISNYLSTQTFPLGMSLITTFFILFGVFTGFTAIILHSLNTHLDS